MRRQRMERPWRREGREAWRELGRAEPVPCSPVYRAHPGWLRIPSHGKPRCSAPRQQKWGLCKSRGSLFLHFFLSHFVFCKNLILISSDAIFLIVSIDSLQKWSDRSAMHMANRTGEEGMKVWEAVTAWSPSQPGFFFVPSIHFSLKAEIHRGTPPAPTCIPRDQKSWLLTTVAGSQLHERP